jgi:hypothetical protein
MQMIIEDDIYIQKRRGDTCVAPTEFTLSTETFGLVVHAAAGHTSGSSLLRLRHI